MIKLKHFVMKMTEKRNIIDSFFPTDCGPHELVDFFIFKLNVLQFNHQIINKSLVIFCFGFPLLNDCCFEMRVEHATKMVSVVGTVPAESLAKFNYFMNVKILWFLKKKFLIIFESPVWPTITFPVTNYSCHGVPGSHATFSLDFHFIWDISRIHVWIHCCGQSLFHLCEKVRVMHSLFWHMI